MAVSFPQVNSNKFSYASITLWIDGRPYRGVKAINYKDSLKPAIVRGTGKQAIGWTAGQYESEGDVELFREEWADVRSALGPGYMERVFSIQVQYQELGASLQTDTLPAVRISENTRSNSEGTDALTVKLGLTLLLPILENGVAPINNAIV